MGAKYPIPCPAGHVTLVVANVTREPTWEATLGAPMNGTFVCPWDQRVFGWMLGWGMTASAWVVPNPGGWRMHVRNPERWDSMDHGSLSANPFALVNVGMPNAAFSEGFYKVISNDIRFGAINVNEHIELAPAAMPGTKSFFEPMKFGNSISDRIANQQDGTRIYIRKELS